MKLKSNSSPNLSRSLTWRTWRRRICFAVMGLIALMGMKLFWNIAVSLPVNSQKPIDAILVLGGSIRREIYVADLAKVYPDLPIIISSGSDAPCIFHIFNHKKAPMANVILENCARSTFDNFVFSVPLLQRKKVHKVRVVTSPTHLPRAKYLAQIHLGAQGIGVEIDTAQEVGTPGNRESPWKTTLDVTRSLLWSGVAQIVSPSCGKVVPLTDIDWEKWRKRRSRCERQREIKIPK